MERGSVFMTNKTQAVRFPKTVRRGRVWTITPSGQSWASWFEGEGVSSDFMTEREQPTEQARDGL